MHPNDPYRLKRFIDAQEHVFDSALKELQNGKKLTHWMWFIFPQLTVLGRSSTAIFYGITGIDEARAYLQQPLLRDRLEANIRAVINCKITDSKEIFGYPDYLKFQSSLTLFALAEPGNKLFKDSLEIFYHGMTDVQTENIIAKQQELD